MEAIRVTDSFDSNDQLLYFTSSSLTSDDKTLIFLSDRTGNPNIFGRNLVTGEEKQLTDNKDGTLKSYVYFCGNEYKGLGKASVSVDSKNGKIYYLQGMNICCTDLFGNIRVLNRLPGDQVTAFTHISEDGKRLCVPTTDARALDTEVLANDSSGNELEQKLKDSPSCELDQKEKEEIIHYKPDYDIDERVIKENLSSYLRVYDTETGSEILCEKVQRAWITHVQFSPNDSKLILYNHEWPSDCGIRRMWLWNGEKHIRLREENANRSKDDWTCHEMWQANGDNIIYHGKYKNGIAYIGKVGIDGKDNIEISLPEEYQRYGHFTAGNLNEDWLVCDGYYHPSGEVVNENWGGEWISVQKVDWHNKEITWIPLCKHYSFWNSQDSHPHPIFNHGDTSIYYTSNKDGKRAVYRVDCTF